MDSKELYVKTDDGFKPSGVHFCGVCKNVSASAAYAEKCCQQKRCKECGADMQRDSYHTFCQTCSDKHDVARELERFNKATKVQLADYQDEMVATTDGEYISLEYLWDQQDESKPNYVYGVRRDAIKLRNVDDETLYSDFLEDGFDLSDIPGFDDLLKELNRLIDEWNATNNDTYEADYSVVIELDDAFWADSTDANQVPDVVKEDK